VFQSSGNVGIGTASPAYPLHVAITGTFGVVVTGTYNAYLRADAAVAWDAGFSWAKAGTTKWNAHVGANSNDLNFYEGAAYVDRVTFQAGGNVGIGTTGPLSKLDVAGGIAIGSYAGANAAPSNGLIASGKVGVGTTNPVRPLHVSGGDVAVDEGGGFGFHQSGASDLTTVLYRAGGSGAGKDITILRNYNVSQTNPPVYSILKVWAPSGAFVNDREATLTLSRGDSDEEFMDVYNNGYSTETQCGIRIVRNTGGQLRDFVFDQLDNTQTPAQKIPLMILKANTNVGIGTQSPSLQLQITKAMAAAVNAVAFSSTPAFDASLGNTQTLTLTGNVTSSTLTNAVAGEWLVFDIVEDATGGRSFAWPSNFKGGGAINTGPSKHNVQMFYFDGTNAWAVAPIQSN
jgi:hypothetical protein